MTKIERMTLALLGWSVVMWLTSAELTNAVQVLARYLH